MAVLYELPGGKGNALSIESVSFTVIGGPAPAPAPTVVPVAPTPSPVAPTVVPVAPTPSPVPPATAIPTAKPVPVVNPSITSFTLVNADTNSDILTLVDGVVLSLPDLPSINIRANTMGVVGSVQFLLNGGFFRNEDTSPYALVGTSRIVGPCHSSESMHSNFVISPIFAQVIKMETTLHGSQSQVSIH